ncbi:MAG: low molecular weight phosphotyrosine protein phosphatase [Gammaproteobacteria bacterium]|nr:low molecular weight phosphotyrosine protein phosphatase [Gammaproteobacteria bacterium]
MTSARRILFVCTGNICRSPLAQGLMEAAVAQRGLRAEFVIDSAGTQAHTGIPPEPLAIAVAATYGVDIAQQRSRPLGEKDYVAFDLLVGLDLGHLDHLRFMRPAHSTAEIQLLLGGHSGSGNAEVPDPYGGGREDFEYAARLIEIGTRRLLERLLAE